MTKTVVWDFDGVLNDNMRAGRFLWADDFDARVGAPLASFVAFVFGDNWDRILTGQEDIRSRLQSWFEAEGLTHRPEDFLSDWLQRDTFPEPMLGAYVDDLSRRGVPQVIATNNEPQRAAFIADQMGWSARVDGIFASGTLGLRKPDSAFFHKVAEDLGTAPTALILVDDTQDNIRAARAAGWSALPCTPATRATIPTAVEAWLGGAPVGPP
ncbi:MAG: HAD-IA family hydrolase [Pseudomonadota bacterium]